MTKTKLSKWVEGLESQLFVTNSIATAETKTEAPDVLPVESSSGYEVLINALPTSLVRNETMEGRKYIVVPMIMITEGVHNGSKGPVLYTKEHLSKNPSAWDHKPIVVNHPTDKSGSPVSACSPEVIDQYKIGVIMNTRFTKYGQLKADAFLEETRIKLVDNRVLTAIKNKKMMELSTGVVVDFEKSPGDFKGKSYTGLATNLQPDHLAILPDTTGACSIADGAGFIRNELGTTTVAEELRKKFFDFLNNSEEKSEQLQEYIKNEMSHESVRSGLYKALSTKFPTEKGFSYPYIESVFDDYTVYSMGSACENLFRIDYSVSSAGVVTLTGEPKKVVRKMEYAMVGNEKASITVSQNQKNMNTEIVNNLIANGGYSESDREWLSKQDEATLNRLTAASKAAITNATPKPAAPLTLEGYINAAPKEIREVLTNGQEILTNERNAIVEKIIANKGNTFTKEELQGMPVANLRKIASLIPVASTEPTTPPANYTGLAPIAPTINSRKVTADDALIPHTVSFGKK